MTGEHNPTRRITEIDEMLAALSDYWHAHPYMRLGQLIANFSRITDRSLWNFDHADLELALTKIATAYTAMTPVDQAYRIGDLGPEEDG